MNPAPAVSAPVSLPRSSEVEELTVAVLRGARAIAVALDDLTAAADASDAAEAAERLDLTVRLTAEMARLYDDEVARTA